jgi:outer membrane receptor protein involved in Fe transport
MKNRITESKKPSVPYFLPRPLAVLVAGLLSMSPVALMAADDLDGPTISVTASRVAEEIKETPVTIEIIDKEEIDRVKFVDSVEELLNRIPGNSLTRNLRIPFGGKNYTVNLIDGMAARSFGRGTNGFIDETNTFDIERVEIIKGPASSLYGSNAIGGVINVITRDPPAEPEYRVWGEVGDYDRVRGGFSAAGSHDAFGYFFDVNAMNYDGPQDRTAEERQAISGKLIYDFDMDTSVSFRLEYLDRKVQGPGSLDQGEWDDDWQQAPIDDAFTNSQMLTGTFGFVTGIGDNSELDIKYNIRHHEEQGMPSFMATADYGEDDMYNHNLVATYHRDFDFYRSRIIVGADLQYSSIEEATHTGRSSSLPVDPASSYDILAEVTSPFVQYEISPTERLRFTFGARYDRIKYSAEAFDNSVDEEVTFSNVTPKAGLTYELDENNSMWFGYNEGFVAPGRSALWTSTRAVPDSSLDPETAKNFELGVRGRLLDKRVKYDVALYHTTIKDMVVTEDRGGPQDFYVNAGKVRVKGVETSLAVLPVDFLRFDVAHTYAVNKYLDYVSGSSDYSGNYLSASPLHHINARATWMPRHDLDVELEWDHISSYYTASDNDADPSGKYQRPDLYHLRLSYDQGPWEFWAHALNIFDKKYAYRTSYSTGFGAGRKYTAGDGRTFYTGVTYNWK